MPETAVSRRRAISRYSRARKRTTPIFKIPEHIHKYLQFETKGKASIFAPIGASFLQKDVCYAGIGRGNAREDAEMPYIAYSLHETTGFDGKGLNFNWEAQHIAILVPTPEPLRDVQQSNPDTVTREQLIVMLMHRHEELNKLVPFDLHEEFMNCLRVALNHIDEQMGCNGELNGEFDVYNPNFAKEHRPVGSIKSVYIGFDLPNDSIYPAVIGFQSSKPNNVEYGICEDTFGHEYQLTQCAGYVKGKRVYIDTAERVTLQFVKTWPEVPGIVRPGITTQQVLAALIHREWLYSISQHATEHTLHSNIIYCLGRALEILDTRSRDRKDRAVEGTHEV